MPTIMASAVEGDQSSGSSSSIVVSMATGHHLLRIDGYSHTKELAPNGKSIRSRSFRAAGHSWHITYYPNGLLRDCADHIAVYLTHEHHADGGELAAVKVRAKFSLLDHAGEPVPSHSWTTPSPSNDLPVWGFYAFVRRAWLEASPHLKDDGFAIRCDVFVYSEDAAAAAAAPPPDLSRHLGGLLASGDAADVAFRVAGSGETFRAHRCVLAARSPVFRAELLGPMREGDADAVVEVGDMEAEVFRLMLEFVYTDALPEEMGGTEEEAAMCQHLLVAADRYGMERLKLICEGRLRKHIDASSAATILALAEQHRCPGLKDACFRFLETPGALAAVAEAEGFEHLSLSCPTTLKELVFRIMDR